MKTSDLITIFDDTLTLFNNNKELVLTTREMVSRTKVFDENYYTPSKIEKNKDFNISVVEDTTFSCAKKHTQDGVRVAVLNFANPHTPGGGVAHGARAQEECLCRCSNLYYALTDSQIIKDYYEWNKEKTDYMFSDKTVYSPNVCIVKEDETYLEMREPFYVDVITCAAPYNVYGNPEDILKATYLKRIKNILEVAIEHDVDVIILGAFGCGAFRNPPKLMAESFKEILIDLKYFKYFKKVVFAIKKPNVFENNLEVFRQVFFD